MYFTLNYFFKLNETLFIKFNIVSQPAKLVARRFEPPNEFYQSPSSQKFAPTLGLDG